MTLFDVDAPPPVQPSHRVRRAPGKPRWNRNYRPVNPVDCDHCCEQAYDSVFTGAGYAGIRQARQRRTHGGLALRLCNEHANILRAQDARDYGSDGD